MSGSPGWWTQARADYNWVKWSWRYLGKYFEWYLEFLSNLIHCGVKCLWNVRTLFWCFDVLWGVVGGLFFIFKETQRAYRIQCGVYCISLLNVHVLLRFSVCVCVHKSNTKCWGCCNSFIKGNTCVCVCVCRTMSRNGNITKIWGCVACY